MSQVTAHDHSADTATVTLEGFIATLLTPVVFGTTPNIYFRPFQAALGFLLILLLFRLAAAKADNPNRDLVTKSFRWSNISLQFALLGAVASVSLTISDFFAPANPAWIFAITGITLAVTVALLDQIILREYADSWLDVIHQETCDNPIGRLLRTTGEFGTAAMNTQTATESRMQTQDWVKALSLGTLLSGVLLVVMLPIVWFLSLAFGDWGLALLVVLSILLLRDLTRYVYLSYGSAPTLSSLKYSVKTSIVLIILQGLLLAGVFGHQIPISS